MGAAQHRAELPDRRGLRFGPALERIAGETKPAFLTRAHAAVCALAGEEAMADGHLISDEEAWYVADTIPNGSAAAIILIEHLWAIPLRDAIISAGGIALADRGRELGAGGAAGGTARGEIDDGFHDADEATTDHKLRDSNILPTSNMRLLDAVPG